MKEEFYLPTPRKKEGLKKTYPAFIVLAVSLALVLIIWRMLSLQVDERIDSLYESEKKIITEKLKMNLDKKIDILKSFQNLYSGKVQIVRDVFELYVTVPQKMNSDIVLIGFAPQIKKGMEAGFLENARNEGYSNFSILPSGSRTEYFPVANYLPYKPLLKVVGADLYSDPVKAEVIKNSFAQNEIELSPATKSLISDMPVLMLSAPVKLGYSGEVAPNAPTQGVCFVEIDIKEYINAALGMELSSLAYEIYDGTDKKAESLIFKKEGDVNNIRKSDETVKLAGRKWIISFTTLNTFAADVNKNLPMFVLLLGIVISLLLFGFTYSLLTSRSRAQEIAERMTRSQRRIMDASQDIIGAIDLNGKWKFLNPAAGTIFGVAPETLTGKPMFEMVHSAHRTLVESAIFESPDEKANQFEAAFVSANGEIRWFSWSITLSKRDELVYMIGRDITDKRKDSEIMKARSRQIDVARMITERENYLNEKFRKEQSLIFRTELTSTLGFLSIILSEGDNLREDQKQFIENARSSADGVLNAVKNVLDVSYAKLSDVSFNIKAVGASAILRVIKELKPEEQFNLELPEELKLSIETDENKLRYSLENITKSLLNLNNNGKIKIHVSENRDDGVVEIEFISAGIEGIPELFHKTIIGDPSIEELFEVEEEFNVFISREFIEVMNGSIGVVNDGSGLRVSVMFYENI